VQKLNSGAFVVESERHADSKATAFQKNVHQAAHYSLNTIDLEYRHKDEPVSWLPALPWAASSVELEMERVLTPSGYSVDTYHPNQRVAIEADGPTHFFACERRLVGFLPRDWDPKNGCWGPTQGNTHYCKY
jgi:hypothetical protein